MMRATHDPGPLTPTSAAQFDAYRADTTPGLEQVRDDVWSIGADVPEGVRPRVTLTYLFRDADGGIHVVDPGWNLDINWTRLVAALAELGATPADVRTVIATHQHPDHSGLVDRLVAAGATFILGRNELLPTGAHAAAEFWNGLRELRSWGVPIGDFMRLAQSRRRRRRRRHATSHAPRPSAQSAPSPSPGPAPTAPAATAPAATAPAADKKTPARRNKLALRQALVKAHPQLVVGDGDVLPIPGFHLEVLATPGHTPGHICLTDAERDIVLTGDLILPTRFPGLGLGFGSGDDHTAIADYLESIAKLPGDREALPGHGYRFRGLDARVAQSAEHHLRRVREAAALLEQNPRTSVWTIASKLHWVAGWENLAPSMRFSALRQTAMLRDYILSGAEIPPPRDDVSPR